MTKAANKKRKRKTVTPIQGQGFIMVDIENPNFNPVHVGKPGNPEFVSAIMNPRESPIAWYYHHRRQTRVEQHHVRAANEFRRLYERTGGAGVKALDYGKEPVDGGNVSDGITDMKIDAAKVLAEAFYNIGSEGYILIEKTCGELLWLKDQYATRYQQNLAMKQLIEALDVLAEFWGYQNRTSNAA